MHQLIHISSMCILRKSSLHATFKFIKLFSTSKLRDYERNVHIHIYGLLILHLRNLSKIEMHSLFLLREG